MKDLIVNNELNMTSYEFLTNIINPIRKSNGEPTIQNRHFLEKVEDEIDDLGASNFITRYGNKVKYYDLNYEQMMLIGMRESKVVRKNVLEKLKELSKENSFSRLPNFNDPAESARSWADQYEARREAEQKLIEQAPKVEYYDTVAKNESHLNASQVGQKVGLSAKALNKLLEELGVYNRSVKRGRVFNQWFVDKGFGLVKQTALGYSQAVFTVKGEQYVIQRLYEEGLI